MYCLRCGSETEKDQVFCGLCLEKMEKHPIKPGTPVRIPTRTTNVSIKNKSRRKTPSPEEMIVRLKVHIRTLLALLGASIVIGAIFAYLYFQEVDSEKSKSEAVVSYLQEL